MNKIKQLLASLPYSYTLNMEAAYSSEISIYIYQSTRRDVSDNDILQSHRSENIKPHTELYTFP
jgi:hypothetical protein